MNGGWGVWGSWGACSSKTWKAGTKTRTRQCNNPAPSYDGAACTGLSVGESACPGNYIKGC